MTNRNAEIDIIKDIEVLREKIPNEAPHKPKLVVNLIPNKEVRDYLYSKYEVLKDFPDYDFETGKELIP